MRFYDVEWSTALVALAAIIVMAIWSVTATAFTDRQRRKRERDSKQHGRRAAIIYTLRDGRELLISWNWVIEDAEESARFMRFENQGVSSILNHRDFEKVTGERFEKDRLTVRYVPATPRSDFINYSNKGLEDLIPLPQDDPRAMNRIDARVDDYKSPLSSKQTRIVLQAEPPLDPFDPAWPIQWKGYVGNYGVRINQSCRDVHSESCLEFDQFWEGVSHLREDVIDLLNQKM